MKINVGGSKISFEVAGSGDTVLFLHAFPLSSAMWAAQAEALAGRYRVVRMDARGFGASDVGHGPLTMERIADDAAAVLDHLEVAEAVVCGCSMGGYAALRLAAGHPSRVRALVLADTRAAADSDEARGGRGTLAQKVLAEGASAAEAAMMPKLLGETSRRERPQLVAQVGAWVRDARPQAIANALFGMGMRPDSRPALAQIAPPCLVIRGEEDVVSSAQDVLEMTQGIHGSRALTIPRAGHLANLETPERFNEALLGLLAALPD